jgi:predicted DNA-binding transcriptional regulator AlpA
MENERNPHSLDDERLLGTADLAKLLGRSQKAIRIAASKRPETLPPRFRVPGTRLLRWRWKDVKAWMDKVAALTPRRLTPDEWRQPKSPTQRY